MATMEMDWILIKKAQQMITFFLSFKIMSCKKNAKSVQP